MNLLTAFSNVCGKFQYGSAPEKIGIRFLFCGEGVCAQEPKRHRQSKHIAVARSIVYMAKGFQNNTPSIHEAF
jgi:hypothetical protein